jgi:hypothetical protein
MERAAIREDMCNSSEGGKKQADLASSASPGWVDTFMTPADIALLIGGPLIILLFLWEIHRHGKLVLTFRGLFRFPAALLVSIFGVLGTSLLYAKVNPYVCDTPLPRATEFLIRTSL